METEYTDLVRITELSAPGGEFLSERFQEPFTTGTTPQMVMAGAGRFYGKRLAALVVTKGGFYIYLWQSKKEMEIANGIFDPAKPVILAGAPKAGATRKCQRHL